LTADTNIFRWSSDLPGSIGINTCVSGDCSLPGETLVATTTCQTAVTVFSVDYDAPQGYTESVKEHLEYTVLDKMNTAPGSYKKKREWTPRGRSVRAE
jgi:5'-nucleotidase